MFFSVYILLNGIFNTCRFPSFGKASKPGKPDVTPAKGSLTSGKLNLPQIDILAQPQTEVDVVYNGFCSQFCLLNFLICLEFFNRSLLQNLSAKLYTALRMLRTAIVREAGDGVMAYHIFG